MTVAELIRKLKALPQDARVVVYTIEDTYQPVDDPKAVEMCPCLQDVTWTLANRSPCGDGHPCDRKHETMVVVP